MSETPTKLPENELPENVVEVLNATLGGFNTLIGLRITSAKLDEVCAEVAVRPEILQPYGLVHGGIYSTMIETLASIGAAINAMPKGQTTVGLENSTSFIRGTRAGTLHGKAVPLTRGRRTHVWQVTITDDENRVVATGRVRMICLEKGSAIAGATVALT